MAQKRLMQELVPLQKEKWVHIEPDESNILHWLLGLWVVNPESVWHGAYLRAEMQFPHDYPYQPPTFRFMTKNLIHPNIYSSGNVCISILHRPGDDITSGEQANERWNVLHGAESVLRSVLLLLDDPEINSAANIDASILYRDRRDEYDIQVRKVVQQSLGDVPDGVVMPTPMQLIPAPVKPVEDDADFWNLTDVDDSFGGSDSDEEQGDYEDEDEDDLDDEMKD